MDGQKKERSMKPRPGYYLQWIERTEHVDRLNRMWRKKVFVGMVTEEQSPY